MKRILSVLLVAAGLAGVVLLSGFTGGDNNAAGIQKDYGCAVIDGYGWMALAYSDISIANHGGNVNLVCKAKWVPTPGYEVEYWGFPCGIIDAWGNWYVTTNSYNVVSEDGNVTLRCQVKK